MLHLVFNPDKEFEPKDSGTSFNLEFSEEFKFYA